MALTEAISILATIKGVDLVSDVLKRVSGSFGEMSEAAQTAAASAEEAAARIDAATLQTASGEDAATVATARVTAARAELDAATTKQAAAEKELIAAAQASSEAEDGDAAATKRLVAANKALADSQKATIAATREMQASEEQLSAVMKAASGENVAAAREQAVAEEEKAAAVTKSNDESAASTEKAKNAAFMGAAAVAAIGYESVKSAMNFQTLTQRLVTTAGESQSALGSVRTGIMQVAQQTGTSANDLAQSMYTVEAAGYDAAHGGMDVLKASTEGAQLEGSDFGTVANAVTDILKDYHKGANQAANVTSQLVAAVSSGKANFQTMSASMANVLPIAASVGLKFNDVAGMLAEMTSHGVTAQRASQNLAMAIRSLEGPSTAMTKEWKALGITTKQVDDSLSTRGLGGTMNWLAQTAAKGAPKIGQTYAGALKATIGTAAGLNVMLETTGKNSGETAKAIAKIGAASSDANGNVKGFSEVQKTAGYQMNALKASITNTGIAIGTALLPAVVSIAKSINQLLGPIMKWIQHHQTLVATAFKVAAALLAVIGAVKAVTVAVEIFEGVMDLLEANPWVAAITALVLILIYCWTHFKTFREVVMAVMSAVGTAIKASISAVVAAFHWVVSAAEATWHGLQAAWNAVVGAAKAVWGFLVGIWNAIASVTTTVWNGIKGFFEKWWPLLLLIFAAPIAILIAAWNHFHSEIESVAKAVWGGIKSFFSATWNFIKAAAQAAWELIKMYVVQPVQEMWRLIQPIIHTLESFLGAAWNFILGVVKGAWNLIKEAIIQPIKDGWNMLVGFVKQFMQIGQDIVTGIINGISGAAGWLMDKIKNLADDALKAAKSFLGIGSPSKKFAEEIGQWIPHGIAQGINDHAAVAKKAVSDLSNGLTAQASSTLNSKLSVGGGFTVAGAALGGAGAAPAVSIHFDLREAKIMNDRDVDVLVQKIEKRLATITLPSGGYRSRF